LLAAIYHFLNAAPAGTKAATLIIYTIGHGALFGVYASETAAIAGVCRQLPDLTARSEATRALLDWNARVGDLQR
jgi:hypothetical protein